MRSAPPPDHCPICHKKFEYTREEEPGPDPSQDYQLHMHNTHPEYEELYRRRVKPMVWAALALALIGPATILIVSPTIIIVAPVTILFVALIMILWAYSTRRKAVEEFRTKWLEEHGAA